MKTELRHYTVAKVLAGFVYNEFEGKGLFGLAGHLVIQALLSDLAVTNKRGIYEYVLDGKTNPQLLDVRIFSAATKREAYARQTAAAKAADKSNCPLCAAGTNNNATRIYALKEMEADHVTAWSKGGATVLDNCEMLCVPHNRSKGNR